MPRAEASSRMVSSYAESARPPADLRKVKRIFDRRAPDFASAAFLRREIAQRMAERLEYIRLSPVRILDVGCGMGEDLGVLQARFPEAAVFGLDASYRMARLAGTPTPADASPGWRRLLPESLRHALGQRAPGMRAVQADFAAVPFAGASFELVWSSQALHWHARPDAVFPEWNRVLGVGGLLMFNTLGPDSLRELRAAWRTADGGASRERVIDFVDMHDFGDMLVASGFGDPVMDAETLTITYRTTDALLADVRRWGAYPFAARSRPAGLGGKRRHAALIAALEDQRRPDGTLALTVEVIYGHAWKVAPRTTPEGFGIVRLEDVGRRPPR